MYSGGPVETTASGEAIRRGEAPSASPTRRRLLLGALLLLGGPLAAAAQPPARPVRVGLLTAASRASDLVRPSLVDGLRELGYVEGQNLTLESRYAEGRFDRLPEL